MALISKSHDKRESLKPELARPRLNRLSLIEVQICARRPEPPCGFGIEPVGGGSSRSRRHDKVGVIAPSPTIFAAAFLAAFGLDRLTQWPSPTGAPGVQIGVATLLTLIGSGLCISAIWELRRARTNALLDRTATAIAQRGVYSLTRNPICLGWACLYAASAVALDRPLILLFLPPALAVVHFGVVIREERYLVAKFGAAYARYRNRAPRWI